MKVIQVNLEDLKPAEYNPRALTRKEAADLEASIKEFGMVEPILVNSAEERKNIIIGGHQRFYICKKLGHETIPVVYINIADETKERELNLRLNKNLGHWDMDMLANFEDELLERVGFTRLEIDTMFKGGADIPAEIEFATELLEEHNYIVVAFDNKLDWQVAQDKLGLKTVQSNYSNVASKGLGRVIKGKDLLEKLK